MPFPGVENWNSQNAQPPPHVLAQMGGSFDANQYYWNPDTYQLVDRYTGGSYSYDRADPANGTDVVTDLSEYNQTGQAQIHYDQGQQPYFGFGDSAQGYDAGDAPNSGMFISADPNAIDDYQSHRQDVVNRGVGSVAALVGGAALGGALSGGGSGAAAGADALTGVPSLPPGVGYMAGGVPSVTAAGAAGAGGIAAITGAGAIPAMASLPAAIATPAALQNFLNNPSGGSPTPTAGVPGAGGGGGVPNALGEAAGNGWPSWITDALLPGINSLIGANAADKAGEAQERAALAAIEEQRRQYDTTRTDLQPWLTAGQGALGRLQDPNAFQASPSYGFRRDEGMRGIENSFAAGGMGQSGNALKALTDFNSNLASQEHGQWWNQQAGLAGVGQTAGTNLGQMGQQTANNVGNALQNYGDARASGYLGRSAAAANGINDGMYNYLYRRQR